MKWLKWLLVLMIVVIAGFMFQSVGVEVDQAGDMQGHRGTNAAFGLICTVSFLALTLFAVFSFVE